jgi:hypothetical protein
MIAKIMKNINFKGSSLTFSAQGVVGKEKILKSAEKIAVGSEGAAEGGVGGIPPRLSRSPAVAGWRASARGGGLASLVWFRSAILDKMSSSKVSFGAGERTRTSTPCGTRS